MTHAKRHILGLSAYFHDSAACLVSEGRIVCAAQEERFSRVKHDARFPAEAIRYCLQSQRIQLHEIDRVVFYESPRRKFGRLLSTYLALAPFRRASFAEAMAEWLPRKIQLRRVLRRELERLELGHHCPSIVFGSHHRSHAASGFYPSPFSNAAVLCIDGVGEWETTSGWYGHDNHLDPLWSLDFPHSLGLLYSAFTQYTGFRVNSGEYKVMGLAPYGRPEYVNLIYDNLIDLKPDGSFRLNLSYFDFPTGFRMVSRLFEDLCGGPCREPEGPLLQRHMDLARSIQDVTEEVILRLATTLHRETGSEYLCMAGGVALNCVANGRLVREGPFKDVWIQPAAGDAGGAIGAALAAWHEDLNQPRSITGGDQMQGGFLGPQYTSHEVETTLNALNAHFKILDDDTLCDQVARLLAAGKVIGWISGRMEFGPRALGARSILGDPRNPQMQFIMNHKIKFRESFRPFAPAVLCDAATDYFELDRPSPYMLLVAPVRPDVRVADAEVGLSGLQRVHEVRSLIPAVTHVDYSARVQTVHPDIHTRLHALLTRFRAHTGCAVLINTSFNVRGEPIVCTPQDAYRCFMKTDIDYLVVENCLLDKSQQPAENIDRGLHAQLALD